MTEVIRGTPRAHRTVDDAHADVRRTDRGNRDEDERDPEHRQITVVLHGVGEDVPRDSARDRDSDEPDHAPTEQPEQPTREDLSRWITRAEAARVVDVELPPAASFAAPCVHRIVGTDWKRGRGSAVGTERQPVGKRPAPDDDAGRRLVDEALVAAQVRAHSEPPGAG